MRPKFHLPIILQASQRAASNFPCSASEKVKPALPYFPHRVEESICFKFVVPRLDFHGHSPFQESLHFTTENLTDHESVSPLAL